MANDPADNAAALTQRPAESAVILHGRPPPTDRHPRPPCRGSSDRRFVRVGRWILGLGPEDDGEHGGVLTDYRVTYLANCFPMIPSGKAHNEMLLPDEATDERVATAIGETGRALV